MAARLGTLNHPRSHNPPSQPPQPRRPNPSATLPAPLTPGNSDEIGIGIAEKNSTTSAPATGAASASADRNGMRKPTPIGCVVRARALATRWSTCAAEEGLGIIPRPPASETAAANSEVRTGPPSYANCKGSQQPTSSIKPRSAAMGHPHPPPRHHQATRRQCLRPAPSGHRPRAGVLRRATCRCRPGGVRASLALTSAHSSSIGSGPSSCGRRSHRPRAARVGTPARP
jgi:hypothetical protein